jgi:hypothetical protein
MRQYVIGLVVTDVLRAVFSFITSGRHYHSPSRHNSSTKLLWKPQNFTFSTIVRKLITSLLREVSLYPVGTCRDAHARASVIFTKILMLMNDRMLKDIQIFQIYVWTINYPVYISAAKDSNSVIWPQL